MQPESFEGEELPHALNPGRKTIFFQFDRCGNEVRQRVRNFLREQVSKPRCKSLDCDHH